MAEDYKTQEQEAEFDEEKLRSLILEAATHVINGIPRHTAINYVKEIDARRSEAERRGEVVKDENGFVESYLDSELEPPSTEGINEAQIKAIYFELCATEGIDPE